MGELLSTRGPETNHLAYSHYKESMNFTTEATVIEVDDRYRDEILLILMIVGPLVINVGCSFGFSRVSKNGFKQDAAD